MSVTEANADVRQTGGLLSTDICKHSRPFYSLDEVHDVGELEKYYSRFAGLRRRLGGDVVNSFYLDVKLVGVPVQLLYNRSKLTLALTKYTGYEGEDVTNCVINLPNVPERIRAGSNLYIRGEIVIHRADFYAINQQLEAQGQLPFKTMKDCVEDTLRRGDIDLLRRRILRFYGWEIFVADQAEIPQTEQIKLLQQYGFNTPWGSHCESVDDMTGFINEVARNRASLPYFIDGVVVKQNDPDLRKALGVKKGIELAKCVWRFTDEGVVATVKEVEWSVDRTSRLVPYAVFDPVNVNGYVIDKVSLYNASWVETNGVGVGSKIVIDQSGNNPPHATDVLASSEVTLPTECPCCHSPVKKVGTDLFCTNFHCPDLLRSTLTYLVTDILHISEFSPEQINALIESKTFTKMIDFFLPQDSKTPTVSQDSLDRLVAKMKNINLLDLILLMGIPNMGRAVASKLASETCGISNFIAFLGNEKEIDFMQFSIAAKTHLKEWIKDPARRKFLKDVAKLRLTYCGE